MRNILIIILIVLGSATYSVARYTPVSSSTLAGPISINQTGTTGVTTFVSLGNEADTIPRFSWVANGTGLIFSVGTTSLLTVQENGAIAAATGPFELANRFSAGDLGVDIISGADGTIPLKIRQNSATQTGALTRWTSRDAATVYSSVTGLGVYVPRKVTGNPCADTTGYPEAATFYNDTSDYMCFCPAAGAAAKQVHSPATACF